MQTFFGIDWYDSSARYQTTDGLFSGIDPHAIFSVYDRNQNLIYKTVVRVQGVGGRDQSALSNTQGCIRIADDDILELKMLTESLEKSDPLEEKGILQVANDLESPVKFTDRQFIKDEWERYLGELPAAIVTAKRN